MGTARESAHCGGMGGGTAVGALTAGSGGGGEALPGDAHIREWRRGRSTTGVVPPQKDGQPLVLAERIQALLGGQRLEIQDAQVSCLMVQAAPGSPGAVTSWCARGRRASVWQDVGPASSLAQRTPVKGD